MAAVDGDIDGIMAGLFKLQVLDVDDEVAGEEVAIIGKDDIGGEFDARHDGAAVFVDEVHAHLVLALLDAAEDNAQGDGTLRVHGGELMGDDGIEGAEEVEFASVISGGIAEHGYLDIHGGKQWSDTGTSQTKTKESD